MFVAVMWMPAARTILPASMISSFVMRRLSSSTRTRSFAASMPMLTVPQPARFNNSTLYGSLTSRLARTLAKKGKPTSFGHFSANSSSQSL